MASLFIKKSDQFETTAGAPASGYYLHFLTVGTTTPKNTYPSEADAVAGTNANSNPITLNAAGRSANDVWITGRYRFIFSDNSTPGSGTTLDTALIEDAVPATAAQADATTWGGNNTGTANALVFAYSPVLTAYVNGSPLRGRILADTSTAVTVNGGPGVKSLVGRDYQALPGGALQGPCIIEFCYDSTSDVCVLLSAAASADALDSAGNGVMRVGTHTIPVLAGSMLSRTTNGAADGLVELATNDVMLRTKDFDQTTSEGVQFTVPFNKSWNEGTITAQFGWTAASGAGTAIFTIAGLALSDDDAMDAAFGTAQSATDTLITANDLHISPVTPAVTIAGTPAEGDMVVFQVTRDIADTLNADAKLIWVKLFATISAANDA